MTPYECYKTYLSLKSHFTRDSYDYFKYGGKVSASVKSFEARRDKFYFEKLSKLRDPTSYILANIIHDPNIWVGDLVTNDQAEKRYTEYIKRSQSLTYSFKNDTSKLLADFDSNFRADDGRHPPLLQLFLRKEVSLETLIILVHMTKCFQLWNTKMEYDPVWRETARKIVKYQPFMKYDISKLKQVVKDTFSEYQHN